MWPSALLQKLSTVEVRHNALRCAVLSAMARFAKHLLRHIFLLLVFVGGHASQVGMDVLVKLSTSKAGPTVEHWIPVQPKEAGREPTFEDLRSSAWAFYDLQSDGDKAQVRAEVHSSAVAVTVSNLPAPLHGLPNFCLPWPAVLSVHSTLSVHYP